MSTRPSTPSGTIPTSADMAGAFVPIVFVASGGNYVLAAKSAGDAALQASGGNYVFTVGGTSDLPLAGTLTGAIYAYA